MGDATQLHQVMVNLGVNARDAMPDGGVITLSAENLVIDEKQATPEIKAGFYGGTQQHRNEILLRKLLAKTTVGVLLPSRETAEHYARLFVQLKRSGTPVPDNDLWIAALALEHDLLLITRDQHFERIPQLLRG